MKIYTFEIIVRFAVHELSSYYGYYDAMKFGSGMNRRLFRSHIEKYDYKMHTLVTERHSKLLDDIFKVIFTEACKRPVDSRYFNIKHWLLK